MAKQHAYDMEMVKTLRRTVEYWRSINHRPSLSPQDKATLKRHFLRFVALPHAARLTRKYSNR